MTRLFLTGATGYLGQKILRHALDKGHAVKALYRAEHPEDGASARAEWTRGDLSDPGHLQQCIQGCDVVIHTAALVSIWKRDNSVFFETNVEGTKNLLEAVQQGEKQRVIYTSSFFALGPTGDYTADENWWNTDVELPTPYAQSKRDSLELARRFRQQGLDITMLYPGLVYGPGKATEGNYISQMVSEFAQKKLPGILGDGQTRLTFSFVDDVAEGHLLALKNARPGSDYILGGEDASLMEFLELLEELTKVKRPRLKIPFSVAKILGWMEETRARFSSNYLPKLTRDVVEVYKHNWRYSSQKAIKELGYRRTPIKEGLVKILESQGYWKDDPSTIL